MVRAGCRVKLLLADCFALLNKRLDGDPARIWAAARRMVEVWRALGVGVDGGGGVEILWSSEEIIRRSHEYWSPLVMDIAQRNSVKRIRGYACTPRARSFVYQKFRINLYSEILMVMHILCCIVYRCCTFLDREKKEELTAGQFLYPIMQCADVFFFQVCMRAYISYT
jgi:tyrosyl-tRNA synthetase